MDDKEITFKSLGVADEICKVCERLGWQTPTPIQRDVIPLALDSKDIIGIAQTGSGKTAAFAIPIVQALLKKPVGLFALVLVPTRELAEQVSDQFKTIGAPLSLKTAVIVGGQETSEQRILLAKRPHVIVATPGRIADHLANMKGLNLRSLKYLVLDEADRMLSADFEGEVNQILKQMPRDRISYLFSATLSKKVERMKRLAFKNPETVEIAGAKQKLEGLVEHLIPCPAAQKDVYFCHVLLSLAEKTIIVFCDTRANARRVWLMINYLYESERAILLHGDLSQDQRTISLNKIRNKECMVLVCTDICSRGIDIPHVDVVINLDLPKTPEAYTHRVGRTARAGRSGIAYIFVTEYEVGRFKEIERNREEIPVLELNEKDVLKLEERVYEARATAKATINKLDVNSRKRKTNEDDEEVDESTESAKRLKMKSKSR